ncbi:MAG TPA: hypothetical protein VFE63_17295 [Roseiarcus sp.]|jgi:hypothetical protein|nr:hypothetical protein [Roseiarcus sp.]
MFGSHKTSIALSLAALTLATALSSTPASAKFPKFPIPKPFPFHHYHHGWGWGPGLAVGLVGAAVAADVSCTGYSAIYDQYGHYLGQQAVNVCY